MSVVGTDSKVCIRDRQARQETDKRHEAEQHSNDWSFRVNLGGSDLQIRKLGAVIMLVVNHHK